MSSPKITRHVFLITSGHLDAGREMMAGGKMAIHWSDNSPTATTAIACTQSKLWANFQDGQQIHNKVDAHSKNSILTTSYSKEPANIVTKRNASFTWIYICTLEEHTKSGMWYELFNFVMYKFYGIVLLLLILYHLFRCTNWRRASLPYPRMIAALMRQSSFKHKISKIYHSPVKTINANIFFLWW